MIRAGRLRHKITISSPTAGANGNPVPTYSATTTAHASYEALEGTERFSAQQTAADVTARFVMRYQSGIGPEDRVTWDGRTFDIVRAIDPDGTKAELHLEVREAV